MTVIIISCVDTYFGGVRVFFSFFLEFYFFLYRYRFFLNISFFLVDNLVLCVFFSYFLVFFYQFPTLAFMLIQGVHQILYFSKILKNILASGLASVSTMALAFPSVPVFLCCVARCHPKSQKKTQILFINYHFLLSPPFQKYKKQKFLWLWHI